MCADEERLQIFTLMYFIPSFIITPFIIMPDKAYREQRKRYNCAEHVKAAFDSVTRRSLAQGTTKANTPEKRTSEFSGECDEMKNFIRIKTPSYFL